MNQQSIIKSIAESLNIKEAPPTLCCARIEKIEDFNIRYLSFLTYLAHTYETQQIQEVSISSIVRDWEEISGFTIASMEVVYRIKTYFLNVILGNRPAAGMKGFRSKGFYSQRKRPTAATA